MFPLWFVIGNYLGVLIITIETRLVCFYELSFSRDTIVTYKTSRGIPRRPSDRTQLVELEYCETDGDKVVAKAKVGKCPEVDPKWPLEPKDPRVLALNIKQVTHDDQIQIEANVATTSALRCNSCQQFLGTKDDAIASKWNPSLTGSIFKQYINTLNIFKHCMYNYTF